MSKAQLLNPRKRQRTEQHSLPSPPSSKRQNKLSHHSLEPPAFWDGLSKIWLTKRALRELDRRNAKPLPPSSYRPACRPITRAFQAKQKNIRQRISTANFLCHCTPSRLKDVKRFARCGGPDLSDIINICTARFLMFRRLN